jgi:periplasmic protein TonB
MNEFADRFEFQLEEAMRIALRRESPSPGFAQRLQFQLALQTAGASTVLSLPGTAVLRPRDVDSLWTAAARVWQRLFSGAPAQPAEAQPFQGLTPGRRSPASLAFAVVAHGAVLALILFAAIQTHVRTKAISVQSSAIDIKPWLPVTPHSKDTMGGGGGGGDHDLVDVSKGRLPQLARRQIVPPQIVRNDNPKLAVEPTIVMPKNIQPPDAQMPDIGLPTSSQVRMASNGAGSGAGMGSGRNGGIGSGYGTGYGPGSGGGWGGGIYHVCGGVSAPLVLSSVDPEYSDEARRAKFTGIVVVALVVDPSGMPQRVHVIRHLGMGLDEKAIEAVEQYRFRPAEYQGRPVPVEVNIEVNFQIY